MITNADRKRDVIAIRQLANGNLEGLTWLYKHYGKFAYRTAVANIHDQYAAHDICQDSFLQLAKSAATIQQDLPLKPWFHEVIVNLCHDWQRNRDRKMLSLDGLDEILASPASENPAECLETTEQLQDLRVAIMSLPEMQRDTIIVFYFCDVDTGNIGALSGARSHATVLTRLHNGRKRLLELLSSGQPLSQLDMLDTEQYQDGRIYDEMLSGLEFLEEFANRPYGAPLGIRD